MLVNYTSCEHRLLLWNQYVEFLHDYQNFRHKIDQNYLDHQLYKSYCGNKANRLQLRKLAYRNLRQCRHPCDHCTRQSLHNRNGNKMQWYCDHNSFGL